jgi:hypothetical protein
MSSNISASATTVASTPESAALAVPLVIAVTGHRDLVQSEVPEIRRLISELLKKFLADYPERRLQVMSALAEGADQLTADVALELGVELVVVLPMDREEYRKDFDTPEARQRFDDYFTQASASYELPLARGNSAIEVATDAAQRARQYAQLGVFLCAHCHVLLAIWDGKQSHALGGTGQVVKFHHDDIMPGFTRDSVATQQMLVDDESDLVYHIVCSRDRSDGAPAEALSTLSAAWFTKDRETPRSAELPVQHQLIFERSSEFSRDALQHASAIESECYPLYKDSQLADLPSGVDTINRLFCIADWLAIRYQRKVLLTLRGTHVLAFLMGLMFILYTDVTGLQVYMIAFLLFFMASAGMHYYADRLGWHRKYLDYRTLAEGLRVQFYWAVAGVGSENDSKFTHDNFLQTQDPELGWIRNVMRVAGTKCDAKRTTSNAGLEFVLREWIGDTNGGGQLAYFANKSADKLRKHRITERLGQLSLLVSVGVVLLLVVMGRQIPDNWSGPLMAVMGTMLLLYAIRQGFAYATAEKDLIKQYDFMLRLFLNARRRLDTAEGPQEQRQILQALGGSSLDEHAEWILMHRDRAIDQGEIWRMGS